MSGMKKKIVWLPYDMDTAIGIDNQGALVFSYNLEDIDRTEGGAYVFNGQNSVLWKNLRACFGPELKAMYQELRSSGKLSYERIEKMFEEHQAKWPEAIFNEDAQFKYIDPLIESGTGEYLTMLQGSKAEQRKWWLYNRFRYLDSKYNAGDARTDAIMFRSYAKGDITVTPYADIYATVLYGSVLVSKRAARNKPVTLLNTLDQMNNTETAIYSASQLASIGDLSPLLPAEANFAAATRIQSLKIGDAADTYQNGHLTNLVLGNNVLLKILDVRNCPNLANPVDISGCLNIEEVYFDGTSITGCTLPDGGFLKVLHLPATVTNLTIMNQKSLRDLTIAGYSNLSTVRIENAGSALDIRDLLKRVPEGARVRLMGFRMEAESADDITEFFALLDKMRGLDETGSNMDKAQVSGTIHTAALTGAQIADYNSRYPYVKVRADHTTSYLYYYNYDGSQLLYTETIKDGGNGGSYTGKPSRASTAANTFTFIGWSREPNSITAEAGYARAVIADRKVYAAYKITGQVYTVRFYNDSKLLKTVYDVPYGGSASYGDESGIVNAKGWKFKNWSPVPGNIQGNTDCYAQFVSPVVVEEITDDWETIIAKIANGTAAYKVGNYKPMNLGNEGPVNMQIVAENTDEMEDGTKARYSWLSMELLKTKKRWNPDLEYNTREVDAGNAWIVNPEGGWMTNVVTPGKTAKAQFNVLCHEAGALKILIKKKTKNYSDRYYIYVNDRRISSIFSSGEIDWRTEHVVQHEPGETIKIEVKFEKDKEEKIKDYTNEVFFNLEDSSNIDVSFETHEIMKTEAFSYKEGTGIIGGWDKSELAAYYRDDLYPTIPEEIRNAIKPVVKGYNYVTGDFNDKEEYKGTTVERVWAPSRNEIDYTLKNFSNSRGWVRYDDIFVDKNSIKKAIKGESDFYKWSLRTIYHAQSLAKIHTRSVAEYGNLDFFAVYMSQGIALGFCI